MNRPQGTADLLLNRRAFLRGVCAAGFANAAVAPVWGALAGKTVSRSPGFALVAATDRERILKAARVALMERPATITDEPSPKSPGGPHSFFSQADYFWPDPAHPNGPYINRDGESNPDNFDGHRRLMVRLSLIVPTLTAAWLLTGERKFGSAACDHLRAWFVTPATRMDPDLEFAQGVMGASTGRSYGIIDTLHLAEVARAASLLAPSLLSKGDREGVLGWFREYLHWMTTSEKGKTERAAKNNHATCWALQASEYARLIGEESLRDEIRTWFREQLLGTQMGVDGSFPQELARTKPYGYSMFNFDVTGCLAQSLTTPEQHVTTIKLPDGRGFCKAAAWIYPYLKDKSTWPYRKDVQHFDAWPVRSPSLLFAGLACQQEDYIALWKRLDPDPSDKEIIRNYPVRQPLLWV